MRRPSASLVPRADDRSTLLTTAGMQPQMPFFLGREAPPAPLTTTAQKCFRTPDIDEVGLDTYHLTCFEMLGNFSFGRYFKEGAIEYAPEFIRYRIALERTAQIVQQVESVYDTDGYQTIMRWIAAESGIAYGDSVDATKAHRVLADHGRGMTFLVSDGVTPSNEGRGYVLRRVIRRAAQHGQRIGMQPPFLAGLADAVIEQMGGAYPELAEHRGEIQQVLTAEEERFGETLERGMKIFEEAAAHGEITGEDAFTLQATYGFPIELTQELARERGLGVNDEEYTKLFEEHRKISRRTSGVQVDVRFPGAPRTEFVGYERTEVPTAIVAYADLGDGLFQAKLERSPFYPAGGGQVSDLGTIAKDDGTVADLVELIRLDGDQELVFRGEGFAEGDRVTAKVPWSIRFPTMANHTATHVLHECLREVLGEHVKQAGSAVRPDKLRFDFTHPQALSTEERTEVERRVNERVFANLPVRIYETPIDEARKLGAMMLFGEKYGDIVRVVDIDGWSVELCGGTHVRSTAEIGPFVVLNESSVGAGARRIEAVTSGEAFALLHERAREADDLRGELARARKEKPNPQAQAAYTIAERVDGGVFAEAADPQPGPLR